MHFYEKKLKFLQFWYLVCLLILHALLVVVSVIILILYMWKLLCACVYIYKYRDPVVDIVLYLAQLYNLLWYHIIPG